MMVKCLMSVVLSCRCRMMTWKKVSFPRVLVEVLEPHVKLPRCHGLSAAFSTKGSAHGVLHVDSSTRALMTEATTTCLPLFRSRHTTTCHHQLEDQQQSCVVERHRQSFLGPQCHHCHHHQKK